MSNKQRYDDIGDDEIRIIGNSDKSSNTKRIALIAFAVIAIVGAVVAFILSREGEVESAPLETQQIPIYGGFCRGESHFRCYAPLTHEGRIV